MSGYLSLLIPQFTQIQLSIDPIINHGISTEVYLDFLNIRIAKASGSLKDGGILTVGLSNMLDGTLMFKVEEKNVVLYYGFYAFANGGVNLFEVQLNKIYYFHLTTYLAD